MAIFRTLIPTARTLGGTVAAALAIGASIAPASAATTAVAGSGQDPRGSLGGGFDFVNDASYILTMRAGAVEPYTLIPRYLPMDIGHSYVDLVHDIGASDGRCETIGAGYWLGTELEEAVLGPGFAPPAEDGSTPTGYQNPTISRTVRPDPTPPGQVNVLDKTPAVPATGNGPMWTSSCESGEKGSATGDVVNAAGARVAGSTTSAEVDRGTGRYTGTSRAYVGGVSGAGTLDAITSLMQVEALPGAEPQITYRISFFDSEWDGQQSAFSQNGFTVSGTDIPAGQLVDQFNNQSQAAAKALEALGPLGFTLLDPQVRTSTDGGRFEIVAPVVQAIGGLAARSGTAGEESGVRFGSAAFTGVYGGGPG